MTTVRIKVGPEFARWAAGFAHLPQELLHHAAAEWREPTERFFQRTQQHAHILSGDMISSGHTEITTEGLEVTGRVIYGKHAAFEEIRGGPHALISRGWEEAEGFFTDTMPRIFTSVVASWR